MHIIYFYTDDEIDEVTIEYLSDDDDDDEDIDVVPMILQSKKITMPIALKK